MRKNKRNDILAMTKEFAPLLPGMQGAMRDEAAGRLTNELDKALERGDITAEQYGEAKGLIARNMGYALSHAVNYGYRY